MQILISIGVPAFALLNVIFIIWLEIKILAHVTDRFGPMRTGKFHGWLQPIADVIKLLNKEDIVPAEADRLVFKAAPYVLFVPIFMTLVTIPLTPSFVVRNLDIGVFYVMALSAFSFVGMVMAGWSSYNKYSLLAAFRAAGQLLSYELPFGLAIAGIVMLAESLSLVKIVEAQTVPNILLQPIGFLVFLMAMTAELTRTPFDLPQAESELVAGFSIEYSGIRWTLFYMGEFLSLFILCSLTVLLFLGGWKGPLLPPLVWFMIKVYAVFLVLSVARGTLPRIRPDQLMTLGWKILLPATFVNLLMTAGLAIFVPHQFKLWLAVSQFAVLGIALYMARRLLP